MTRKEIYEALKAKGLIEKANAEAKKTHRHVMNPNYTNLSNDILLRILDTVKKSTKKVEKKSTTQKCCIDEAARKEILRLEAILDIANPGKNFK